MEQISLCCVFWFATTSPSGHSDGDLGQAVKVTRAFTATDTCKSTLLHKHHLPQHRDHLNHWIAKKSLLVFPGTLFLSLQQHWFCRNQEEQTEALPSQMKNPCIELSPCDLAGKQSPNWSFLSHVWQHLDTMGFEVQKEFWLYVWISFLLLCV